MTENVESNPGMNFHIEKLPTFINCSFEVKDKGIRKPPHRIFVDVCCFLDFIERRNCKNNGYPLWYASTILISEIMNEKYEGAISQSTLEIALTKVSNFYERMNQDGVTAAKEVLTYKNIFYVMSLTDQEYNKAFQKSNKYHISIEDSIQLESAKKSLCDTFVTRDVKLLKSDEVNKEIQVVKPETIVGKPPHNFYCKEEVIKKQPEFLKDRLKDFMSAKDLPFDF